MKKCKILYYSRNQKHAEAFEAKAHLLLDRLKTEYLKELYNSDKDFLSAKAKSTLYDEVTLLPSLVANTTINDNETDLGAFIDSYKGKLSELYLIIDYVSLCGDHFTSLANSIKIRELLLKYPEVNFAFDEHLRNKYKEDFSFVDFLITDELDFSDFINAAYTLSEESSEPDISGFRQFIKDYLITIGENNGYKEFVKAENENQLTDKVAIIDFVNCHLGNEQNPYLVKRIVNNDFHSFDITKDDSILKLCYFFDNLFDASNLRFALKAQKYHNLVINKTNFARLQLSRATNLAIVVEEERSQSLFNCYSAYASGYRCLPVTTASNLKWSNNNLSPQMILRDYDLQFPDESGDDEIHQVRGWRNNRRGERIPWECFLDKNNSYWGRLYHLDQDDSIEMPMKLIYKDGLKGVLYISKGVPGLSITIRGHSGRNPKNNNELTLSGVEKPISGVYSSLIPMFRNVYNHAVYSNKNGKKDYLDTRRKKGFHGVPLDIYYMVKSMVDRAWKYYAEEKRYIHAAVLAQEIIEVLNGFHEALLIKAYHILAVSENAIAMNAIGGDEEALKRDTLFRIDKINGEIERILRRKKDNGKGYEDRREFKYNVLNQIYSDCRKFCKDKEHFLAEDCFISAMAHVNEGFTPCDIWDELILIKKKLLNSWEAKKSENFNDAL